MSVDLTELIERIGTAQSMTAKLADCIATFGDAERDEIVLALRVMRVLRTTQPLTATSVYTEDDNNALRVIRVLRTTQPLTATSVYTEDDNNSRIVVFDERMHSANYAQLDEWERWYTAYILGLAGEAR